MLSHRTKKDEKGERIDGFFSIDVVIGGFSIVFLLTCLLYFFIHSFIHS